MRSILIALLLINISVFGYFQFFGGREPTSLVMAHNSSGFNHERPLNVPAVELLSAKLPLSTASKIGSASSTTQNIGPICTLVGAFGKLLQAEYFVERLSALGLTAEIKNIVVSNKDGYWLYLPPEASRKEALRRLSELHKLGIDSYVIPSGNLENGISLGMFAKKESAEAMSRQVAKQGYRPAIINVPREQKEIWVFLPEGEAAKLTNQRWVELISDQDYLQKRQNLCVDIASS